jgi:chemotaxis protein methyltransferase CheR
LIAIDVDPGYADLKNHLIGSTGLAFYLERDKELAEVIGQRLADLRLPDCSSYSHFLNGRVTGKTEMDVLIAKLTIGETSFFRDAGLFDAIRDVIFPEILERNRETKRLRIWSAGCATGAEPYSVAILLAQMGERIAGWETSIVATDLNRDYLARAAEGKFRAWALRSTSEAVKRECFSQDGPTWTIHPQYKRSISFRHMNLIDGEFGESAYFDLILCRNVMIYFLPATNRRIVGQFHQSLDDGGWLVVGAAEHNLENYKAFTAVNGAGATLYQKVASKYAPLQPAPEVKKRHWEIIVPKARAPLMVKPAAEPKRADPDMSAMDELVQLADRGDWQAAAEQCRHMLTFDRLNAEIHFYQALIFENLLKVDEAERSLRQALYLDRNFALAHYHLGLALKRDGKMPASRRSFGNVRRALTGLPDNTELRAGRGITAVRLNELAGMQLGGSDPS